MVGVFDGGIVQVGVSEGVPGARVGEAVGVRVGVRVRVAVLVWVSVLLGVRVMVDNSLCSGAIPAANSPTQ